MPNLDLPKGFECWGKCLRVGEYESGSACYPGDLVNLAADGQVDPAAAAGIILGVCLSYASAAGQKILVADHPDQLVVANASAADIDAQGDVASQCDHLATAGSSTYKTSRHEIDSASISTSSTLGLTILRIEPGVNNALGANVKVVCSINEHRLAHGTGQAAI